MRRMPSLRVRTLASAELEAARGGTPRPKGSYCGNTIHCECGWVGDNPTCSDAASTYKFYITDAMCPGCGGYLMRLSQELQF